jgi:hypothetical protein
MTEKTARTIINKPKTFNRGEIENVIVSIIAASPFNYTISLRSLVTLNNLMIFVIYAVHESDVMPNAGFENIE